MADPNARDTKLIQYLNEAYGKEKELETALQAHIAMTTKAPYKKRLQEHLKETKGHAREVKRAHQAARRQGRGRPDRGGPDAGRRGGHRAHVRGQQGRRRGAGPAARDPRHGRGREDAEEREDRVPQRVRGDRASTRASSRSPRRSDDKDTAKLARGIRREEERMAKFLEKQIEQLAKAVAREEIPAAERATAALAVELAALARRAARAAPRTAQPLVERVAQPGSRASSSRSSRHRAREVGLAASPRSSSRAGRRKAAAVELAQRAKSTRSGRSAAPRPRRGPAPSSCVGPPAVVRRAGFVLPAWTPRADEDTGRDETEKERLDRNLEQLLGELRVALPGVQVLFAFLLVVPFNQRFADITSFQQTVYFVTLLCATAACACLIAPTAHHRIEFREQDKERIVFGGNRLAIAGLTLLAVAMTGAITLVTDFLYSSTTTRSRPALVALLFAVLWYAIPLRPASRSDLLDSGDWPRTTASAASAPARARARGSKAPSSRTSRLPVLQQQHVVREAQLAFGEVRVGRAVEEEVRRALDPDRALAVDAQALDAGGLARDLAEVLGSEVAAELADEQPESGAAASRASRARARRSSESSPPGARVFTNTPSGRPAARGTSGSKPSSSRARSSVVRCPSWSGRSSGADGMLGRRSTVAPWSPKNSSTASRTPGTAAKTPPASSEQRRRARSRGTCRKTTGPPRGVRGAGDARRSPDRTRREVGRLRPVELAAELGEALLEVAHASTSPSSSRSRSSARETRDLTVPRGQSSAAAVSSSLRSSR